MSYDINADRHGATPSSRDTPAVQAVMLTDDMISDVTDLGTYAKALRVWNGSSGNIVLAVTPTRGDDDTVAAVVRLTVPPGAVSYEPISVRRIWWSGSTGLAAALAAGTAEVVLLRA